MKTNTERKTHGYILSKSKIKDSENCDLMLWNDINQPQEKVWDSTTQYTFEQGRVVEALARSRFSDGLLQYKKDNVEKVEYTKKLLKLDMPIFEAAFAKKGTIIQFDVLYKNANKNYNAVEVKSSSKFKPEYETDVLIQYWIATLSGIKIDQFELWVVNNQASDTGSEYFKVIDLTEFVKSNERRFWAALTKAQKTSQMKTAPEVKIGAHCEQTSCPYRNTERCSLVKSQDSVHNLPNFRKNWEAYHEGITSVTDARFEEKYTDYTKKNPVVMKAIKENKLVIEKEALLKEFQTWTFPLNFFDFEALMGAIPVLEGQRPYEQVVIQFSNHVYNGVDNKLQHQMFLHDKLSNPDEATIEAMLMAFESNSGSIVSYNMSYEKTRISDLAKKYPLYAERLSALLPRFVDLMDLIKHHVYHPAFEGSYSLKSTSPVILGEYGSYSDSLIKSGAEIAKFYIEMITTKDSTRKQEIYDALVKYCSYDTLNLFLLLKYLLDESVDLKGLVELNLNVEVA